MRAGSAESLLSRSNSNVHSPYHSRGVHNLLVFVYCRLVVVVVCLTFVTAWFSLFTLFSFLMWVKK